MDEMTLIVTHCPFKQTLSEYPKNKNPGEPELRQKDKSMKIRGTKNKNILHRDIGDNTGPKL